jgi:hypothetical protein
MAEGMMPLALWRGIMSFPHRMCVACIVSGVRAAAVRGAIGV